MKNKIKQNLCFLVAVLFGIVIGCIVIIIVNKTKTKTETFQTTYHSVTSESHESALPFMTAAEYGFDTSTKQKQQNSSTFEEYGDYFVNKLETASAIMIPKPDLGDFRQISIRYIPNDILDVYLQRILFDKIALPREFRIVYHRVHSTYLNKNLDVYTELDVVVHRSGRQHGANIYMGLLMIYTDNPMEPQLVLAKFKGIVPEDAIANMVAFNN